MTELEAHEAIRDAMNAGLANPNYFVWMKVEEVAPDHPVQTIDLERVVKETDDWLNAIDPDDPGITVPEREVIYETVTLRLKGAPKKREARGQHSQRVAPHVPVITSWTH